MNGGHRSVEDPQMTSSPFPPAHGDSADRPRRRATRPAAAPTGVAPAPYLRSAPAARPTAPAPAGHQPAPTAPAGEAGSHTRRRRGGRGRGAGQLNDTARPAAVETPAEVTVPAGD